MALADTYRRRLHESALDQYGLVTTRAATELGVPPVELRKIAGRGGLDHVAYGLYRFADIPRTDRDQFMEAVLPIGPDAYLTPRCGARPARPGTGEPTPDSRSIRTT